MNNLTAWEITSEALRLMAKHCQPGVDTLSINNVAANYVREQGGVCFNKGYKPNWAPSPYPAETAICLNDEIVHGIPSLNRILKLGDIVNLDLGVLKEGQCGDAGITVVVGGIDVLNARNRLLLKQAKKALLAGIKVVKAGVKVREIAKAIEGTARQKGFVVNRNFSGHAIGKEMHQQPTIIQTGNYNVNNSDFFLKYEEYLDVVLSAGMRICIEPLLTESDPYGVQTKNGWTYKTRDGKPSAMFEHMLEITQTGCKILTTHLD